MLKIKTIVMDIHWNDAKHQSKEISKEQIKQYNKILEEVCIFYPEIMEARDIHYYAEQLNENNPDSNAEKITANDIRWLNMLARENDQYDYLDTFIDDFTDDVIGFF
jgi:hypothetical protein